MRSLHSRLARLEMAKATAEAEVARHPTHRVQLGHLRTLPADYDGPRHIVTVKEPPDENGAHLYQWEERPGPPPSDDDGSGEVIHRVCFV